MISNKKLKACPPMMVNMKLREQCPAESLSQALRTGEHWNAWHKLMTTAHMMVNMPMTKAQIRKTGVLKIRRYSNSTESFTAQMDTPNVCSNAKRVFRRVSNELHRALS